MSFCFSAGFLYMPTVHGLKFSRSAPPLLHMHPRVQASPSGLCSSPLGLVGLSLSYALSLTGLLSGLVSSFTQTETMLVSVERLEEYSCDLPQEPQGQLPRVGLHPRPRPGHWNPGGPSYPPDMPHLSPTSFPFAPHYLSQLLSRPHVIPHSSRLPSSLCPSIGPRLCGMRPFLSHQPFLFILLSTLHCPSSS